MGHTSQQSDGRHDGPIRANTARKSKMADGRHLKIVKCDISATVWPILVKFGTVMQIRPPSLTVNQKFQNFETQDCGWRPYLKSKNFDISNIVWLILLKFCTIIRISSPELTSCSKKLNFSKSKMAEGHHFDNCLMRYYCLIDFDEICMVMHISCSDPISGLKFEN